MNEFLKMLHSKSPKHPEHRDYVLLQGATCLDEVPKPYCFLREQL